MNIISNLLNAAIPPLQDGDINALSNLQTKLQDLVTKVYPYLIAGIGAVVVLWAVYLGVKWWSAGDQDKRREAKEYIRNFIIGTILIFVLAAGVTALIGFLSGYFST
ncbi:MAG: hypothetical protein LBU04_03310 [Christensenellaceae bacterium]|jgi:hypothetical protein|nr:hypothetical protein [Christensenellaceae bacterium]